MSTLSLFQQATTHEEQEREVLDLLQVAFAAEFELWRRSEQQGQVRWQYVSPSEKTTASAEHVQATRNALASDFELLETARAERAPQVSLSLPSRWRLALPLPTLRGTIAGTAVFTDADPDQLLRQAQTLLESLELRDQNARLRQVNGSLTLQVTENFEELAFVRALASHLQLPGCAADPLRTAPEILEKLRLTIKAEGLALVLSDVADQEEDQEPSLPRFVLPALWAKDAFLHESQLRAFLDRFRGESHERPLIQNHIQSTTVGNVFPSLRQCIVVEVGHSVIRGWLLAFNRILGDQTRKGYRVSEQEFGTVEATLMQSASSSLATHFHNVALLRQKEDLFTEVVRALVNAVEARDPYTCGHSERVAMFSRRLAAEAGIAPEACDQVYLSGLLHDVGKIGVSDATLRKPGRLTDEEFAEISRHPDHGWAILHDLQHLRDVMPGVLYHHERFDGKGYPLGLAGDAIPIEGRIMAICDSYDAMTSDRPYRIGMPQETAEEILRDGSGIQWDPQLIEAFFAAMPDIVRIRQSYQPRMPSPLPTRQDCP